MQTTQVEIHRPGLAEVFIQQGKGRVIVDRQALAEAIRRYEKVARRRNLAGAVFDTTALYEAELHFPAEEGRVIVDRQALAEAMQRKAAVARRLGLPSATLDTAALYEAVKESRRSSAPITNF